MEKRRNVPGDYTPRRLKAIEARAQRRTMERYVHGVVQRQQHYPIFEVTAGGKTVEWTDTRATAHAVFHSSYALPKRLVMVHASGRRVLLDEVTQANRRMAQQLPQAA